MIIYIQKKKNVRENNPNWPRISDHPQRILIIEGSGSRKTNALLILIKQQDDDNYSVTDKIYLMLRSK